MEMTILIGLVSATAAGLACLAEHSYAERHAWGALERYIAGGITWLVAIAPVLYAALAVEWASLLMLLFGLVLGAMWLATWTAYQKPIAMPEEDELTARIDKELRQR